MKKQKKIDYICIVSFNGNTPNKEAEPICVTKFIFQVNNDHNMKT